MNGYLLDTNVVSALRRPKVFPQVARWVRSLPDDCMWVSVISMGEVRNGIERKLRSDLEQGRVLESWYETLQPFYGDKILPVDLEIAERWGQLAIRQPLAIADGLIAASALVHDLTLATRNTSDFEPHGVRVVNPFL
ncbi:MAG: hypothetical protein B9S38_11915 [Verrucomicrobiia bacterium Tous-C4TDCM]|nr:MAG: hypothetical protein B9S38_11915 [Verrucomicrobiae bacterium Tous-C4TDCM]